MLFTTGHFLSQPCICCFLGLSLSSLTIALQDWRPCSLVSVVSEVLCIEFVGSTFPFLPFMGIFFLLLYTSATLNGLWGLARLRKTCSQLQLLMLCSPEPHLLPVSQAAQLAGVFLAPFHL